MASVAGVVACPRDPGVETALRCSRCETPICPRCLVQTPVGARCRDCARISRSPVYSLSRAHLVRAAAAAIGGGLVMGFAWSIVLIPFAYTIGIFAVLVTGAALGYGFSRMLEFATGRKRGPAVVAFGILGIAIAWVELLLIIDTRVAISGLLAAALGVYFLYQNLR